MLAASLFRRSGQAVVIALPISVASIGVALAQTGDSWVDAQINGWDFHAGNASAPSLLAPWNYSVDWACDAGGAPSWETNCPSDLLYTPNANTGGYQAFGVGWSVVPALTNWEPYCYARLVWTWHNDSGWQETLEWDCDWQAVTSPPYTWGITAVRIKWGSVETAFSQPPGSWPTSTLAFKGNQFPECDPSNNPFGAGTPCDGPNTIFVLNAGYESKVKMYDAGCTWTRTNTWIDTYHGCLSHVETILETSLPCAYKDTNIIDSPSDYVSAVGTSCANALVEGNTYYWKLLFSANNVNTWPVGDATHRGAITANLGSWPGGDELTRFNVDQTVIAPASPFTQ